MNRTTPTPHRQPLLGLFLLVLGVWCGLQLSEEAGRRAAPGADACSRHARPEESINGMCRPGPWGRIAYRTILIEPPRRFLDPLTYQSPSVQWYFGGRTRDRLLAFLVSNGVAQADATQLVSTAVENQDRTGLTVTPSTNFIWRLEPDVRAALYAELGHWKENSYQRDPFRFKAEMLGDWFVNSYLSERIIQQLNRLAYRRGPFWMFSDPQLLLSTITSPYEQRRVLQILYRQQVLLPKLLIDSTTPIDPLVAYWGAEHRDDEVRPLLESLIRAGQAEIDIELLLPELARERMFFYRSLDDTTFRDCHWTSLNFFQKDPDDRLTNAEAVRKAVIANYALVRGSPQFGDLILLRAADSEVVHSCTYIAADIVFTKNGGAMEKPWVLMFLSDVIDAYSLNGPLDVRMLRLKK